ncbi:hypothetical protein WICPIJ_000422 [Wickerhamomyces pijperi]|uniref:Uncharacterized protein n=1 Tax=Wickerhamomyces pijperi TaxID=599730 RepID=A0A9P8TQV0_WICPI|nr:hypothetical protein WICPIJ_000422 [Wickerhamomyces pijperi]
MSSFKNVVSSMSIWTSNLACSLNWAAALTEASLAKATSTSRTRTVTLCSNRDKTPSSIKPSKTGLYDSGLLEISFNWAWASAKMSSKISSLVDRILNLVLLAMVDLEIC